MAVAQFRYLLESEDILIEAGPYDKAYVSRLINESLPNVGINRVCTVRNRFLEDMYTLKKEEYMSRYGHVMEKLLFHATSVYAVNSIVENNFDWRRVSRSKFGMGVSFSNDADYANFFSNSNNGSSRAFILADVLISKEHSGSPALTIPHLNYDTTTGTRQNIKKVYVKYNDNEFLPKYVAYYDAPDRTTSKYYIVKSRRFRF